MNASRPLAKIALATLLVGVLIAVAFAPIAGITSVAIARTGATMESDIDELNAGAAPGVTTIKDAQGEDLAYLFDQRRHPVEPDQISQSMKDAIVAIEDHRFYEHDGVDFQGNFRALASNLAAGGVSQGASTLNQQYVKNYLLLVAAQTDEERAAATEQSIPRKLREIRMAAEMDKELSKDQILTNYLNLVPFGNHSYGIEAAAQTYFGIPAADLSVPQSALLAGMVQSSEYLNPYTNPEGATDRRNQVLQSMADNGYLSQADADRFAGEGLGVLDSPNLMANGCIGAGDRGFFCDYVLQYLEEKGLSTEELKHGGYTVNTTLDPQVQDAAKESVDAQTDPTTPGVAEVMNVVEPGQDSRKVLGMVSSRTYGLDLDNAETILPQPYSMVGNGAGSVFKVFTAAAALKGGYGTQSLLDVPTRYEAEGLGHGGADGCPANKYCVENAGTYKPTLTFQDALAESPNTTFIKLSEQVGIEAIVDMAVDLGMRSYEDEGTYGDAVLAEFAKEAPMGSFTLGPTAVNPLELSNVGATIASGGKWCEPNPITSVTDKEGNQVYLEETPCESALDKGVADALADAMTADMDHGTAEEAAKSMGFSGQAASKTGTTESHQSAAFLGFNSGVAAAPYIFNDGTSTSPLCTGPTRQCDGGSMYGGDEPAQTFFGFASQVPQAANGNVAQGDEKYREGTNNDAVLDGLRGKSEAEARRVLEGKGLNVETTQVIGGDTPYGRVVRVVPSAAGLKEGATVRVQLSDGSGGGGSSSGTADSNSTGASSPSPAANDAPSGRGQGGGGGGGGQSRPEPLISQRDIDNFTNDLRGLFGL
ncbi:transglycosylase domain-containing protein [Corynebacterium sp. 11254D000AR]